MKRSTVHDLIFVLFALGSIISPALAADYDIVIHGGRVIDPASGRDEIADVGISGQSITAISTSPLQGKRMLDAEGLVIAPGFVDLHAHGQNPEAQMLQIQDGVTTALDMEAGALPIRAMFDALSGRAMINFGATASNTCARLKVVANLSCHGHWAINEPQDGTSAQHVAAQNTPTTPEQEQRIVRMLNDEIANGALGYGLLTGYVPASGRRKVYEIFKAAASTRYPVFIHVRARPDVDVGPGTSIATNQEVIADAAATDAPVQIVHLPSTGAADTAVILEMIKGSRKNGADITTEVYPYNGWSNALGDAIFRPGWQQKYGITYSDLQLPETGERMTEDSFNRMRDEHPEAVVIGFSTPQAAVDAAIMDPTVMIASDGLDDRSHPRGAGTFSRVLGHYVRDKGLDLKLALAKMTIMPARRLEAISEQMARKGRLQVGADADITVFDPVAIKDMATYQKPMQPSVGIRYVIVTGVPTLVDSKVVPDLFPGQAVRSTKPL
ncbi:amidohydrolase family protein [Phyllobacterium zundukense]|uniref:Amidohydrolase family protein n=1 Tax=Phyllobacterium zundukense TaxID=1867719 RepID=A0ACD4CVM3_9HYPH|nr:amidohydrolase family protein [Phyllobacterium zundukense]UXN57640.1 amidohydrolase family protein [Phyllobacterium zundukense]